jgi:hypothetical protein
MQPLKAQVRNGHFVIDEGTDLPEGTEVELQVVKVADPFAGMAPDERQELEDAIEEGARNFEHGDHVRARDFLAEVRAKNA